MGDISETPNLVENPNIPATLEIDAESLKKLRNEEKKRLKLEKFQKKQEAMSKVSVSTNQKAPKAKKTQFDHTELLKDLKPGEKKDCSVIMPESYDSKYVESGWCEWWVKEKFFTPEYNCSTKCDKFVICMPPPNVTGTLHLGHALMCAVEDALVRWNRMCGKTVLWNPGSDHAGIATQVVVEKQLKKQRNITRFDLGRDKFLDEIWNWKEEKGNFIHQQMKRLGISVDWDRNRFTMDSMLSRSVTEAFVRLHDRGLIYRADRLVNWSCTLKSAISDIEVEKLELTGKKMLSVPGYSSPVEFGVLCYFYYPVADDPSAKILVATTRIETMLGDVAVAVNPADTRYANLHGKFLCHPFCDRLIPIVLDESVDLNFGSGAVKITPSHDLTDQEIGDRHNLKGIQVIDRSGLISSISDIKPEFSKFVGMKRFECRIQIEKILKECNLWDKKVENPMVIPLCSRSKDVIEPLAVPQWYLDCKAVSQYCVKVVEDGDLKIIPKSYEKFWFHWMQNHRDWCISRQLWWGHRIPAYKVTVKSSSKVSDIWVSGRNIEEATEKASTLLSVDASQLELCQDEDVLDTWFSSGLFPFSIFGWPEVTEDFKNYFPTTLLETGHDILFFWVARMVIMSKLLLDKLPFTTVFLHPMVRDSHGRKMSKSLGNIIDPVDVITGMSLDGLHERLTGYNLDAAEVKKAISGQKKDYPNGIPECGADALRFTLCDYLNQSRDINLDVQRIQGYRFFCNKIWNAFKFSKKITPPTHKYCSIDSFEATSEEVRSKFSIIDKWILSRLSKTNETCNKGFMEYELATVTSSVYSFWLYDLCDIYLESLKSSESTESTYNTLWYCIHSALRILSPFMPFITEELYQRLPEEIRLQPSICVDKYPVCSIWIDDKVEIEVAEVMNVVKALRSLKDQYVPCKTKLKSFVLSEDGQVRELISRHSSLIVKLANLTSLEVISDKNSLQPGCSGSVVSQSITAYVELKGILDPKKELEKLTNTQRELLEIKNNLEITTRVKNYESKVPEHIQLQNKEKLSQLDMELKKITLMMEAFKFDSA